MQRRPPMLPGVHYVAMWHVSGRASPLELANPHDLHKPGGLQRRGPWRANLGVRSRLVGRGGLQDARRAASCAACRRLQQRLRRLGASRHRKLLLGRRWWLGKWRVRPWAIEVAGGTAGGAGACGLDQRRRYRAARAFAAAAHEVEGGGLAFKTEAFQNARVRRATTPPRLPNAAGPPSSRGRQLVHHVALWCPGDVTYRPQMAGF